MSREEIYERLNEVFQDVFGDDDITINDNTTAADVDGCGIFRKFFSLTIPFIKPTIIMTILLQLQPADDPVYQL